MLLLIVDTGYVSFLASPNIRLELERLLNDLENLKKSQEASHLENHK